MNYLLFAALKPRRRNVGEPQPMNQLDTIVKDAMMKVIFDSIAAQLHTGHVTIDVGKVADDILEKFDVQMRSLAHAWQ